MTPAIALRSATLTALALLPPCPAVAQAAELPVAGPPTDALVEVAMALALVVALIVGGAWLLRRLGRFSTVADGRLRVLGGASLGSRERVVLMQVGDQQLLLGVAPGRVTTLHIFDQDLAVTPAGAPPEAGYPRFAALLGRWRGHDGATEGSQQEQAHAR